MFANALLVMSKSVASPFAKNVGLLVSVKFAQVSGEAPCQNVGEGIVDDAEVSDKAPGCNSTESQTVGRQSFNSEVGSESKSG